MKKETKAKCYKVCYSDAVKIFGAEQCSYPEKLSNYDFNCKSKRFETSFSLKRDADMLMLTAEGAFPEFDTDTRFQITEDLIKSGKNIKGFTDGDKVILKRMLGVPNFTDSDAEKRIIATSKEFFEWLRKAEEEIINKFGSQRISFEDRMKTIAPDLGPIIPETDEPRNEAEEETMAPEVVPAEQDEEPDEPGSDVSSEESKVMPDKEEDVETPALSQEPALQVVEDPVKPYEDTTEDADEQGKEPAPVDEPQLDETHQEQETDLSVEQTDDETGHPVAAEEIVNPSPAAEKSDDMAPLQLGKTGVAEADEVIEESYRSVSEVLERRTKQLEFRERTLQLKMQKLEKDKKEFAREQQRHAEMVEAERAADEKKRIQLKAAEKSIALQQTALEQEKQSIQALQDDIQDRIQFVESIEQEKLTETERDQLEREHQEEIKKLEARWAAKLEEQKNSSPQVNEAYAYTINHKEAAEIQELKEKLKEAQAECDALRDKAAEADPKVLNQYRQEVMRLEALVKQQEADMNAYKAAHPEFELATNDILQTMREHGMTADVEEDETYGITIVAADENGAESTVYQEWNYFTITLPIKRNMNTVKKVSALNDNPLIKFDLDGKNLHVRASYKSFSDTWTHCYTECVTFLG